jgi:asparagine synthase (glutamine-hydrolysing)
MCGIAGIISIGPSDRRLDIQERLTSMADCMHHRGPDDSGVYVSPDGRVGLANRRLAIRDLSPAGHMPMRNTEGSVVLTYNGEIYNASELRSELEQLGYAFCSHSDTEVLLHGYEVWGESVVDRLRGIFAFALWDHRLSAGSGGRVFVARDQLGVKPFYYAQAHGCFVFASEIKALLSAGLVVREINPVALVGYLTLGSVPNPLTIFREIKALEPGHTLTVAVETGEIKKRQYWRLPSSEEAEGISRHDAVERVRDLLEEAVRIQLVSDVPLGAFLSGGLDSSSVVALMRKGTSGPIRTCSIVFEEKEYSEAQYARAMAEAVGAEHYERVITAKDLQREIGRILQVMDQPTIDGVNTYFVSQTAREAGLTVALSGLGADELFGGYSNTFAGTPQLLRALRLAGSVPGIAALVKAGIGLLPDRRRWAKIRSALGQRPSAASAYLARRGLFSAAEVKALVKPEVWREAVTQFEPTRYISDRAGVVRDGNERSLFGWVSRAELSTYTHHQLLRDTDVMSMAHSLEVRVPFLDHKLVEEVLRLPAAIKMSGGGPKPLLTSVMGDDLPEIVRERRDKQGFTFPFDLWLRGPIRDGLQHVQEGHGACGGMLRGEAVKDVKDAYLAGKLHWSRPWALAVLEGWEP